MRMGKKPAKINERNLYNILLKNSQFQRAMQEFFPLFARVRHFYWSHFELLPTWARDYSMDMLKDPEVLDRIRGIIAKVEGITPEAVQGVSRTDAEKLIDDIFRRTIQEEARPHPKGDRSVSGSRASAFIDPKDLLYELSSAVWVQDANNMNGHYEDSGVKHLGTGTPEWLNNAFPDPYIYFGIKRWLKKLFTTRIRNIQQLVRYGISIPPGDVTKILAGKTVDAKLPALIAAQSQIRSERLQRDAKVYADLIKDISAALEGTVIGLIRFAMEARLSHDVREGMKKSAPGEVRDYKLLVNRTKALRNRYDLSCDPKSSPLGARLNRKRLSDRLAKTASFIKREAGAIEGYNDLVVQDLKRRRLLHYLAYPDVMQHIQGLFSTSDWHSIEKLIDAVKASKNLKFRLGLLGGFYPSYASDLKAFEEWKSLNALGLPIIEEPINPYALLRAICQALMMVAWQNIDPKNAESRESTKWRNCAIEFTRLVYAVDYIGTLPHAIPMPEMLIQGLDMSEGEKIPDRVTRGLSFLLEVPGIMPHVNLSKELATQVSMVVTYPNVVKNSLSGIDPRDKDGRTFLVQEKIRFGTHKVKDRQTGKEKDIPWFSMKGRGFSNSVWDVLGVLAVIKVFAVPERNLRTFIAGVEEIWKDRFAAKSSSDAGTTVFKDILEGCVLGNPPERKKDYGFVPIPVTQDGDIASIDQTLRQISFTIAGNPRTGYIPFNLALTPQEDVSALNKLLKKKKQAGMDQHRGDDGDEELLEGSLRPEDPRKWGIGGRVKGQNRTPQNLELALVAYKKQAGVGPAGGSSSGTGPDEDKIKSLPEKIAQLSAELGRCKVAEVDLRLLMRRLTITLYLRKVQRMAEEDIPTDLITAINDILVKQDFPSLLDIELEPFGNWMPGSSIEKFVYDNTYVATYDAGREEYWYVDSLEKWFSTYEEVCSEVGIDVTMYRDSKSGKIKETLKNFKRVTDALTYHVRGRGFGRMGLTSELRLTQMELCVFQAQQDKRAELVKVASSSKQIPSRVRYQRALEYLLEKYSDKGGFLYKFFHPKEGRIRCKIKVPDPVALRIYNGAIIGSISLLQPGRGGTGIANIELRGAPTVVHVNPLYLSNVLDPSLNWSPGGAAGLDDNRLPCPRTFNFGRIPTASNPSAEDTDPGDVSDEARVIKNIPGAHLARLAHLWCYGEEGAKVRYGEDFEKLRPRPLEELRRKAGFNTFKGNETRLKGCGASFNVPRQEEDGRVIKGMEDKCKNVVPADNFFRKVWTNCIIADAKLGEFNIDFPFACAQEKSRFRAPTAMEPLNPDAVTRAPSTNDQLGTISGFWGVRRLHEFAKIRADQARQTILRKIVSSMKDAIGKTGGTIVNASKVLFEEIRGQLRRVHRDFLHRNARTETTRGAIGRYLSYLSTFFLAQTSPAIAANERLGFTPQEGKAQLNALVAAMFKNIHVMLVRATKNAVLAGASGAPKFSQVRASGTSMYHFECGGTLLKRGLIDRRASADFGICRLCGRVVDCHQNAARNIASLHPDYKPPPELLASSPSSPSPPSSPKE